MKIIVFTYFKLKKLIV